MVTRNTGTPTTETRSWPRRLLAALAVAFLCAGLAGCGNPILGPDAIHLGMNVTQVREAMGGPGTTDPGDFSTTEGAHITEFYWNYDDIRIHFNMQTVEEIYRPDPHLGIWVRTAPPLPPKDNGEPQPARPNPATPGRPVPGIRTPSR